MRTYEVRIGNLAACAQLSQVPSLLVMSQAQCTRRFLEAPDRLLCIPEKRAIEDTAAFSHSRMPM